MIYKSGGAILLITKDRSTKVFFRNLLGKFHTLDLIISPTVQSSLQNSCVKIIFLDVTLTKNALIKKYIENLQTSYIAVPIFVITDVNCNSGENRLDNSKRIINYGADLIITKPLEKITIEGILFRYIANVSDQNSSLKKYHGLILNERYQYVIYNECKIFLSKTETLLLSLLMESNCSMKCSEIKKAVSNKSERKFSNGATRICIYRIRKKFREALGFNIIGNKYGVGYYITI